MANLTIRVSPPQIDLDLGVCGEATEPEMQVGTAFTGVAVATVHLGHEPPSIRKTDDRAGAYRGLPQDFGSWMAWEDPRPRRLSRTYWQEEVKSQKRSRIGTVVAVE